MKDLLIGLRLKSDIAEVWITDMDKIEGEAIANNRKGKLIFFFEWDLTMSWKGKLNSGDYKEVEGKIHIPNLSEENSVSEIDVSIHLNCIIITTRAVWNVTSNSLLCWKEWRWCHCSCTDKHRRSVEDKHTTNIDH